MVRRDNDPAERRRLLLFGVVYIALVISLLSLSVAIYGKAFTDFTTVTLHADRAGMQLPKLGDVRYNGVLVGQIRSIEQSGDEAVIELGLDPEAAQALPREIQASIMPTTLFGQKFVALSSARRGGPLGLRSGTDVPRDRVHTSVELDAVLARLFPLLRTVRPADLSATLSALATALAGRGEQLGRSLDQLDGYLTAFNTHLPTFQEDLRLLASVADAYGVAAPDLVAALGNLTVTSRTLTSRKEQVGALLDGTADLGETGARVLEANEDDAITATRLSVPLMRLLDRYSPEYNCLLRGIAAYKPILQKTFEGGQVKQYIEFPATQVRAYDERDIPEYNDTRGPDCQGLPGNPPMPWPGLDLANGTDLDSKEGRGNSYSPGGGQSNASFLRAMSQGLTAVSVGDRIDTAADRRITNALLSARSGASVETIPALSTLMYAPMVQRGGTA